MRSLIFIASLLLTFNLFAGQKNKKASNKKTETKAETIQASNSIPTPTNSPSAAPCDSKEDILKKLEEEKKKLKPFSLQGGNTGCSVNEKK